MAKLSEFRIQKSRHCEVTFRHSDVHNGDNGWAMQTPGQRIRSAREDAGYANQGDFAKLVGIAQATLSEIETGESKLPSAPVLIAMCEILKKSPRWFLYGEEGDVEIPSPEESELLNAFRSMDDQAKAAMVATANALKKNRK